MSQGDSMDKGIRSYVPCLLMLILLLGVPLGNLIDDEKWYDLLNPEVSFKDEQNIKLNPYQTIWITNFKEE